MHDQELNLFSVGVGVSGGGVSGGCGVSGDSVSGGGVNGGDGLFGDVFGGGGVCGGGVCGVSGGGGDYVDFSG